MPGALVLPGRGVGAGGSSSSGGGGAGGMDQAQWAMTLTRWLIAVAGEVALDIDGGAGRELGEVGGVDAAGRMTR